MFINNVKSKIDDGSYYVNSYKEYMGEKKKKLQSFIWKLSELDKGMFSQILQVQSVDKIFESNKTLRFSKRNVY